MISPMRLAEPGVGLQIRGVDLAVLVLLPQRLDLALCQVGLREDLAVHLHDHLLDDDGLAGCGRRGRRRLAAGLGGFALWAAGRAAAPTSAIVTSAAEKHTS